MRKSAGMGGLRMTYIAANKVVVIVVAVAVVAGSVIIVIVTHHGPTISIADALKKNS